MESQSLEQVLLTMELITREQLTEALEYQCRLPQSEYRPLTDILVHMELVSWETIERIENYLASPTPTENVSERIRQSVLQLNNQMTVPAESSEEQSEPVTEIQLPPVGENPVEEAVPLVTASSEPQLPPPPPAPISPAANEEWQQMHAMEEWQQMQSLCVEESQGDSQNLDKIMEDLGISDPRALQVGFTIKRKP